MSLFDILACPTCKVVVSRQGKFLSCRRCETQFPIVNDVPVMFPDGRVPKILHEAELEVREIYNPWVHRVILQSLLDNQIVVDIGAGNMALDDPCIIRMDVALSPYVDLVADAHHLPFLPESVDYIFSLAVVEHLRNPFHVAEEMYAALKDGGYVYHECNFVFAYHGYPHHYFNASLQGLEQVFSQFVPLRKGVAPYQMPSFALEMVIETYLKETQAEGYRHGRRLTRLLRRVLSQDLMEHDIYFSEDRALQVAAGTYYPGVKQKAADSSLIPDILQEVWREDERLQDRIPNIQDLSTVDNILMWAKTEGIRQSERIAGYLKGLEPFNKGGKGAEWSREWLAGNLMQEPKFGAIGFDPEQTVAMNAEIAERRYQERRGEAGKHKPSILRRIWEAHRRRERRALLREFLEGMLDWLGK